MNSQNQNYSTASSAESWDEDFEFHQNNPQARTSATLTSLTTHPPKSKPVVTTHGPPPRLSTSSHFTEDWDIDHNTQIPTHSSRSSISVVLEDKLNYFPFNPNTSQLADWAESGPSATPTKRPNSSHTENWDDDFEDKTDSPARKFASHPPDGSRRSRHLTSSRRPLGPLPQDQESWDDEFEVGGPNCANDHSPSEQVCHDIYIDSSDEEGELGFTDKEEDRTVTARSRPRLATLSNMTPPPPVPALPASLQGMTTEPFPRSPVASVFSIPVSSIGRESVTYSSTSHLPLRPTLSGASSALAMLPPSPPIHRERRRLRKKSRPPQFDENIFELQDRTEISLRPPVTPERVPSPPPTSPDPVSPTSNKNALLSRIGSVKKWGVRKKRASTAPSDVMLLENGNGSANDLTPRPPSSQPQSHESPPNKAGNWLFRATDGGPSGSGNGGSSSPTLGLKHERSADRMHLLNPECNSDVTPESSPTKLIKRKSLGFTQIRRQPQLQAADDLISRRPISMQPEPKPRHASYAYGVNSPSTVVTVPKISEKDLVSVEDIGRGNNHKEGSRGFMSGVRKISFTSGQKKHKRGQSSNSISAISSVPPAPSHDTQSPDPTDQLLPPIELQPPSPPRASPLQTSQSAPISASVNIGMMNPSLTRTTTPVKTPSSPQSASLGRAAQSAAASASVPRRNSLGDLKIPARISQAQVGLRRDLVMVREFAANIEQLKELQTTYLSLVSEAQTLLNNQPPPSRATSGNFFNLPLPGTRHRSNTNPVPPQPNYRHIAATLYAINAKYRVSWECAELLIELGGGTPAVMPPSSESVSDPAIQTEGGPADGRKGRERAITLAGDESKSPPAIAPSPPTAGPPSLVWHASTGRHDLSQRQLVLLREMLNNQDAEELPIPEDSAPVNREWRWGDAMNSTVTLPSQDSVQGVSPSKKRRSSRLGMNGLRDMLRSLKKNHSDQLPPPLPPHLTPSTTSLSTDSSLGSGSRHRYDHPHIQTGRRRSKTSTGPELMNSSKNARSISPYPGGPSLTHKASARRPSLASIFRLGQKSKPATSAMSGIPAQPNDVNRLFARSRSGRESTTTEEEDWDRIDSASDLDAAARALGPDVSATVREARGRSLYLPQEWQQYPGPGHAKRLALGDASHPSIQSTVSSSLPGSTRRLDIEDSFDNGRLASPKGKTKAQAIPSGRTSRGGIKSGSVRSAPPQALTSIDPSDPKLAMTPGNIRPLLENAREVHVRLSDCIGEIRRLLPEKPDSL